MKTVEPAHTTLPLPPKDEKYKTIEIRENRGSMKLVHTIRLLWSLETAIETITDPSIWNFLKQFETYLKGSTKTVPNFYVGGKFVCRENAVVTTNHTETNR